MALPDLLPVPAFSRPVRGDTTVPGSKSLTNRTLLLSALCCSPVTLTGALFSEDTALMAEALRRMGFEVAEDAVRRTIRVVGQGGAIPAEKAEIFVGLAGTAARFLTAFCAAAPKGVFKIDGVPQMRKRPMKGLIDALRSMGADIRCTGQEGFFPLEIHARGLSGGSITIDASESSQMLSAVLMVAPLAKAPTHITLTAKVREAFVQMTADLMGTFGIRVASSDGAFTVSPGTYLLPSTGSGERTYPVEPDATAASYFLTLPLAAHGSLEVKGLREPSLQGDIAYAGVLQRTGVSLVRSPEGIVVGHDRGTLSGITQDFHEFSDTFLTLAAVAPLLKGPTKIGGISHTRKQETDRVAGMARELTRLGQHVVETEDSIEIHPRPLKPGQTIETYGDHRFAMSFGILGSHDLLGNGAPWLTIRDPGCCAKTFPHFFDLLEDLRQKSLKI